jgi:hypothetical protein
VRRSNADKRFAVLRLLKDAEWDQNSLRWIAEEAGVSHDLVRRVKGELQLDDSSSSHIRTTGKDGKVRPASRQKPGSVVGDRSPKHRDADIEDEACPNCQACSWVEDAEGEVCGKCGHPFGEPVGDPDEEASQTVDRKNQQDERTKAYKKARG